MNNYLCEYCNHAYMEVEGILVCQNCGKKKELPKRKIILSNYGNSITRSKVTGGEDL